jgi:hypothetical protein
VSAKPTQHAWSSEALFNKALLYVGEMESYTANDWQFGLWSSFSLEFVARAALAHISPTLLANRTNWRNIHYALDHAPTAKQFLPISVTTREVLSILEELLPDFTKELVDFCIARPQTGFLGTDITRMPCSYRQCVTMFTEEMPWLKGHDLELVMGRALVGWLGRKWALLASAAEAERWGYW